MKAVILAGGKGTRLLPITKDIPKALVPVGNSTLIERVITSLPDIIDEVIIVVKYLGEKIQSHIGEEYADKKISYIQQDPEKSGTWHALYAAKDLLESERFLVCNTDDLFQKEELSEMLTDPKIGMGVTYATMPSAYYGIQTDEEGTVLGFDRHEHISTKTTDDHFANGLYILDTAIFSFEPVQVAGGEHGLPQTLLANKHIYPLCAHKIQTWQACNSHEDLAKLHEETNH